MLGFQRLISFCSIHSCIGVEKLAESSVTSVAASFRIISLRSLQLVLNRAWDFRGESVMVSWDSCLSDFI